MTWLDSVQFLQWLSAADLLIFLTVWATTYVGLALLLWRRWPHALATYLGMAMLLTSSAMVFEGFRRFFGYDLPPLLSWLQAALAGGGNIVAWLFMLSLCKPRFRLRAWHCALVALGIVARLTMMQAELAVFSADIMFEPGPFRDAMSHIDWVLWQVGLVATASVLLLAGPGNRSREARLGWTLLVAAMAYEILIVVLTRLYVDDYWPIKLVFVAGFGSWLLWSCAFIYLLRHPGLQIGPAPAGRGATVAG
jgi:hypothetical protein